MSCVGSKIVPDTRMLRKSGHRFSDKSMRSFQVPHLPALRVATALQMPGAKSAGKGSPPFEPFRQ